MKLRLPLMFLFLCLAFAGWAYAGTPLPGQFVFQSLITNSDENVDTLRPSLRLEKVRKMIKAEGGPSLKEMIGQMLVLGFAGTRNDETSVREARSLLANGEIGGLIFMGANLQSRDQVKSLISYFKTAQPKGPVPFLAIDQEGGYVQRLRAEHGFTDVPQAHQLGMSATPNGALKVYQTMARELAEVGFNVNFGPVVDLALAPQNPIIGLKGRSYGESAPKVQEYARAFVLAHRQHNILTSLKHYPGHGSSWTDSHEQFVDLSKSWSRHELVPYKEMIRKGLADMVMVGHLYHPDFSDKGKIPASLSEKAIKRLRREIGYRGLVITDDLGMGAIKKYFPFDEVIVRALKAGNDILLLVDDKLARTDQIRHIHEVIRRALDEKKLSLKHIKQSYKRIIAAKKRLQHSVGSNL